MMKNRLIVMVLTLALCLCMTACDKTPRSDSEQQTETSVTTSATVATTTTTASDNPSTPEQTAPENATGSTPLFYKITDQDGDVAWLLGTIHVGNESMYPLPDTILQAYEGADALAVESDILDDDPARTQYILASYFYTDGTTLKDHVSQEVYEAAVQLMTDEGLYYEELDAMTADTWSSLLMQLLLNKSEYSYDYGIDHYFLQRAYDEDKPIIEVEDLEFHYSITRRFSDALNELILKSDVESFDDPETLEDLDDMINVWRMGDEDAFEAYLETEDDDFETDEERELYKEYKTIMETERNVLMTDYAESALQSGEEVFICVGAAHVVGEDAMVDLLTERGYTVELVR